MTTVFLSVERMKGLGTQLTRTGMMIEYVRFYFLFCKEHLTCITTPLRLGSKTSKIGGLIVNERQKDSCLGLPRQGWVLVNLIRLCQGGLNITLEKIN